MKYPKEQFEKLVSCLTKLKDAGLDIKSMHFLRLHSIIRYNFSEGHYHNRIVNTVHGPMIQWKAEDNGLLFEPIIKHEGTFELYPNDCNDSHIETAMKKALKIVLNS